MSLELFNSLATFGTFVVIAATAIAALRQLRHMRGSNQIAALSELYEKQQDAAFVSAWQFVSIGLTEKMKDPAFRHQLVNRKARSDENAILISKINAVGNFYEVSGGFVKNGLVDREIFLQIYGNTAVTAWNALSECTAVFRERLGPALYEHFEYITALSQDWLKAHPSGTYPANVRRLDVPNKWRLADEQYAASLAT